MSNVDWSTVFADILSGSAVLIIGALSGGIIGYFQGKKKSSLGFERKNDIYQPLLDELYPIGNFELNVLMKIENPLLKDVVTNEYKYELATELQKNVITYTF